MIVDQEYLEHFGVAGMKWGVRKAPEKLSINKTDTDVTKNVKKDYNTTTNKEFRKKYVGTKRAYAKRVEKYGDPYRHRLDQMSKSKLKSKVKGAPDQEPSSKTTPKPKNPREDGNAEKRLTNKIASSLDTGGNLANAMLYSPIGAVVIAKTSSAYGRGGTKEDRKAGKEQKSNERISTRIDTGSNVANALLRSPMAAVVIMVRSEREGR